CRQGSAAEARIPAARRADDARVRGEVAGVVQDQVVLRLPLVEVEHAPEIEGAELLEVLHGGWIAQPTRNMNPGGGTAWSFSTRSAARRRAPRSAPPPPPPRPPAPRRRAGIVNPSASSSCATRRRSGSSATGISGRGRRTATGRARAPARAAAAPRSPTAAR